MLLIESPQHPQQMLISAASDNCSAFQCSAILLETEKEKEQCQKSRMLCSPEKGVTEFQLLVTPGSLRTGLPCLHSTPPPGNHHVCKGVNLEVSG
jgi:hypothetical protein